VIETELVVVRPNELTYVGAGIVLVFAASFVSKRAAGLLLLAIVAGGLFTAYERGLI
jgi:hypothetical protein